jgi:hypothetical protein
MDARRRARLNLAIFWFALIGIPASIGLAVVIWAAFATPTYLN